MEKYYFVGIKGTGMASLAILLQDIGYEVRGSDISDHVFTQEKLVAHGIEFIPFSEANITDDFDYTIVYSGAFNEENNVEIKKAKELGIKMYEYFEMIGKLSKEYHSVAVAGCHGKTTTTKMLTQIFDKLRGCNYIIGDGSGHGNPNSEYFIFEACEYKRHFLSYFPKYAIITNIDLDHVDYYRDIDDVKDAYTDFINQNEEMVVIYGDDPIVNDMKFKVPVIYYGLNEKNDIYAKDIVMNADGVEFTYYYQGEALYRFKIPVYGQHNILNALAVITICKLEGLYLAAVEAQFEHYQVASRRFEVKHEGDNVVIDDYGHHPREIDALIKMIRQKYPDQEIVGVFEPHTYTRTLKFKDEFIKILNKLDYQYICPIYGSPREQQGTIRSEDLVEGLNNADLITFDTIDKLYQYHGKVIVFIGAAIAPYTNKYLQGLK